MQSNWTPTELSVSNAPAKNKLVAERVMSDLRRLRIFADDPNYLSPDYAWVDAWLQRSSGQVRVVNDSCGGWRHLWDVEATEEAASEVPEHLLCASEWSQPNLGSD